MEDYYIKKIKLIKFKMLEKPILAITDIKFKLLKGKHNLSQYKLAIKQLKNLISNYEIILCELKQNMFYNGKLMMDYDNRIHELNIRVLKYQNLIEYTKMFMKRIKDDDEKIKEYIKTIEENYIILCNPDKI